MSMSAIRRIASAGPTGATGTASSRDSGFIVTADSPVPGSGPGAIGPTVRAAPAGASLMLGLQESMTSEAGDREARQNGQKLLAALAELQRALLSDGGGDALGTLLLLTKVTTDASDPDLKRAINSIRLRARIELARASSVTGEVRQIGS